MTVVMMWMLAACIKKEEIVQTELILIHSETYTSLDNDYYCLGFSFFFCILHELVILCAAIHNIGSMDGVKGHPSYG